jgi:adenine/guanine phosphoribosyltransferase-like PRPP-binding protein
MLLISRRARFVVVEAATVRMAVRVATQEALASLDRVAQVVLAESAVVVVAVRGAVLAHPAARRSGGSM